MIDLIKFLFDFILHIDKHLAEIFANYQQLSYAILFLIIFVETGLVIMPFLPGDSLLFATGALIASTQTLNIFVLIPLLIVAAIMGDNINYFVGKYIGDKVLEIKWVSRIVKPEYITRAEKYFEKYGSRTVVIARFIPIVRTITPFVAGVGEMRYVTFLTYSVIGAILWITSLTCLGYFFGNLDIVKNNFELVVFAIIGISILPMVYHFIKSKFSSES
jgi:membrane-associated protein